MVSVGISQTTVSTDTEKNFQEVVKDIRSLASQGAQIVCLQELFQHQYFCQTEDYTRFSLAESIPGPTTNRFQELAKELQIVIVASIFEERAPGIYHNSAAVIDACGSYLGKYRKMHIPDDPGYYEKFYFTPGDQGYKVFATKYGKIGVLICWDQWFPEAARLTAMNGAEILFYPTAIGWEVNQDAETNKEQYTAWQTIQKSHAVANGIHVVTINRTGLEGDIRFWGGSMVINPFGQVLYQADETPTSKVVQLDLDLTAHYRNHWPFFRDRRVDSYGDLTKRFSDEND